MKIKNISIKAIKKIKLIILDVDGVLTDGGLYYDNQGNESKKFNIKDGTGIRMAINAGIKVIIITGKRSEIVKRRAKELGIHKVYQGIMKKHLVINKILEKYQVKTNEIAFIADDILDISLFELVGVKVAVKDACIDILTRANIITDTIGGNGAVREFIEYILKKKNLWRKTLKQYS